MLATQHRSPIQLPFQLLETLEDVLLLKEEILQAPFDADLKARARVASNLDELRAIILYQKNRLEYLGA